MFGIKKQRNILSNMRVSKSLLIIMVGLLFFARGNIMARPDPLKFNRGQIADLTYDEHAKAVFVYKMDLAIPHGLIPNMSSLNKYGKSHDVDNGKDNDSWDLGGTYPFL